MFYFFLCFYVDMLPYWPNNK